MIIGGKSRFLVLIAIGALLVVGTLFYIAQPVHLFQDPLYQERPRYRNAPPLQFPSRPTSQPHSLWNARAEEVKNAFRHAYAGYMEYAAGHDELKPVTNEPDDK